jgi:hypothetical protein
MAEDFSRAFHLGEDGRHIATVDADGVSMAAIRALIDRSSAQRHTIRSLRDELRGLAEHVRHLERGAARPGR